MCPGFRRVIFSRLSPVRLDLDVPSLTQVRGCLFRKIFHCTAPARLPEALIGRRGHEIKSSGSRSVLEVDTTFTSKVELDPDDWILGSRLTK